LIGTVLLVAQAPRDNTAYSVTCVESQACVISLPVVLSVFIGLHPWPNPPTPKPC